MKWVFEGKSETNSKLMSLLLLPLSGSLVFKKLGAEDEEGRKVNPKAAMKAEIKSTIESGLQSLGLSEATKANSSSDLFGPDRKRARVGENNQIDPAKSDDVTVGGGSGTGGPTGGANSKQLV